MKYQQEIYSRLYEVHVRAAFTILSIWSIKILCVLKGKMQINIRLVVNEYDILKISDI